MKRIPLSIGVALALVLVITLGWSQAATADGLRSSFIVTPAVYRQASTCSCSSTRLLPLAVR